MKGFVLIISSLLLMLLAPMHVLEEDSHASWLASNAGSQAEENILSDGNDVQSDVLYDNDDVLLLSLYECQNDDIMPCRINQCGQYLRVLTTRIQWRFQSVTLFVKRLTCLLSAHLTTLINHTTQVYSSFKLLGWQHAADCYVFAFRQIII